MADEKFSKTIREAIKKKNYEILGIGRNPDAPPPLAWYGRIKYGRLALAQTPPLTEVWTF